MKTESPYDRDRDRPRIRLFIGGAFIAIVWILYVVRVIWGVGPARDNQGRQESAAHYLHGALVVTGLVAAWISIGAIMARRQKSNESPPKEQG